MKLLKSIKMYKLGTVAENSQFSCQSMENGNTLIKTTVKTDIFIGKWWVGACWQMNKGKLNQVKVILNTMIYA
jgi:hypothetical protein